MNPKLVPVRWQHAGDHWTAVPQPGAPGKVIVLNRTGHRVAVLCDGTRTAAQVGDQLAAEHGLPPEAVAADVEACLDQIAASGLLEHG